MFVKKLFQKILTPFNTAVHQNIFTVRIYFNLSGGTSVSWLRDIPIRTKNDSCKHQQCFVGETASCYDKVRLHDRDCWHYAMEFLHAPTHQEYHLMFYASELALGNNTMLEVISVQTHDWHNIYGISQGENILSLKFLCWGIPHSVTIPLSIQTIAVPGEGLL